MPLYHAQSSAGSLMITESRRIAKLLLQKPDEAAWAHAIKVENILQKQSPVTAHRQARLIRKRLELIDDEGLKLIAADITEVSTQMLLLAAIRHSRLLGDFMIDIYRGQLRKLESVLDVRLWDSFLHECEQRDPSVLEWTPVTRAKLLQVTLRTLAEAKYLDSTRSLRMTPPLLHPRVLAYLARHKDHYAREAMEQLK